MSEKLRGYMRKEAKKSKFEENHLNIKSLLQDLRKDNDRFLHSYQIECVLKASGILLRDESQNLDHINVDTKPVVVVAPTGAGKSGMIFLLPYAISSKKVLIITPSKIISDQIAIAFGGKRNEKSFLEEIGMLSRNQDKILLDNLLEDVRVISGPKDIKDKLPNVVIVNAQKFGGKSKMSLVYRNQEIIENVENFFKEFDTLIVDEAHHYPAETWLRIVTEFGKPSAGVFKKIIFVTATPYRGRRGHEQFILGPRNEDRIAYKVTQEMVLGVSTRPCKFLEMPHEPSPENVYQDLMQLFKTNKKTESRFVSQAMIIVRTRDEANDWIQFLNQRSRKNSFAIAALGNKPGALNDFKTGDYRVAVTCGVGKEGYNNTNITICVILRKTASKVFFSQFVGRCMRLRRGLPGNDPDRSVARVLSYKIFEQQRMWEERERLAEVDPIDDSGEEDSANEDSDKDCKGQKDFRGRKRGHNRIQTIENKRIRQIF